MTTIQRIHHAAIVVQDLEAGLRFWRDALGLQLEHIEDVPEQASRVAFLPIGDAEIELVLPTTDDSGLALPGQTRPRDSSPVPGGRRPGGGARSTAPAQGAPDQ